MFLGSLISQSNNMFVSPRDPFIGAWDFAGNSDSNIITGGVDLDYVISGIGYGLSSISSERVVSPSTFIAEQRLEQSIRSLSVFSFAGFIYTTVSTDKIWFGLHTATNGNCLIIRSDGALQGSITAFGAFTPNYFSQYHIAVTYNGSVAKIYKNGSLVYTGSISLGSSTNYFGVSFEIGGLSSRYVDNMVLSDMVISDVAISLLASGAMPGPDGFI